MVIGTLLQSSSTESVQLIASRVVTGIGNGINTVNVPIWQAESFKSHNRGVGPVTLPRDTSPTDIILGLADHTECAHCSWPPS